MRPSPSSLREIRRSTTQSDPAQRDLPFVTEAADTCRREPPSGSMTPPPLLPSNIPRVLPSKQNMKVGSAFQPPRGVIPPEQKLLVSRNVAAEMLSISVRGLDYLVATKRILTRRIANRVLIPVAEVRKFAQCDHPERMACDLARRRITGIAAQEAGAPATRERADAIRPISRAHKQLRGEMEPASHRYRKPIHAEECAKPRANLPKRAGNG